MNALHLGGRLRLVAAVVVIVGVIGGGIVLVRRSSGGATTAAQSTQPVPVQVVQAKTGPIRTVLTYSGAIQSSQQVNIAPRISGQLASVNVEVGTAVKAGDRLATLDPGTLPAQLLQTEAQLQSAQARLDLMLAGPRSADVSSAAAALEAADAKLRQIQNPTAVDLSTQGAAVQAAQTALDNGRVAVNSTRNSLVNSINLYCSVFNAVIVKCETPIPIPQKDLDDLQQVIRTNIYFAVGASGPAAITMTTANAAYLTALNNIPNLEQALQAAKDKYGLLQAPSASDIAAQKALVESARANLDNKKLPYTDADIAGARATVAAASASVAAARTSVEQTSITAPFDGLVASKLLEVGATVSSQTPVFVLVAKAVESHLTVDEARIGLIRPDMEAEVSVPAYPNKTFKGKVATIAPLGDARAHTFDVKVFAEDPEQVLRPGMFAQVNVIAATKSNALLVPTAAIVQQGAASRLFIVVNGKATAKTVKIGIADATNSEITEGIAAGDQVVTVGQNVLREGQAVQIATPAAGGGAGAGGGARPSGTAGGSSTPGTNPAGGAAGASPAASGTAGRQGGATGTAPARPSATGTP